MSESLPQISVSPKSNEKVGSLPNGNKEECGVDNDCRVSNDVASTFEEKSAEQMNIATKEIIPAYQKLCNNANDGTANGVLAKYGLKFTPLQGGGVISVEGGTDDTLNWTRHEVSVPSMTFRRGLDAVAKNLEPQIKDLLRRAPEIRKQLKQFETATADNIKQLTAAVREGRSLARLALVKQRPLQPGELSTNVKGFTFQMSGNEVVIIDPTGNTINLPKTSSGDAQLITDRAKSLALASLQSPNNEEAVVASNNDTPTIRRRSHRTPPIPSTQVANF